MKKLLPLACLLALLVPASPAQAVTPAGTCNWSSQASPDLGVLKRGVVNYSGYISCKKPDGTYFIMERLSIGLNLYRGATIWDNAGASQNSVPVLSVHAATSCQRIPDYLNCKGTWTLEAFFEMVLPIGFTWDSAGGVDCVLISSRKLHCDQYSSFTV